MHSRLDDDILVARLGVFGIAAGDATAGGEPWPALGVEVRPRGGRNGDGVLGFNFKCSGLGGGTGLG